MHKRFLIPMLGTDEAWKHWTRCSPTVASTGINRAQLVIHRTIITFTLVIETFSNLSLIMPPCLLFAAIPTYSNTRYQYRHVQLIRAPYPQLLKQDIKEAQKMAKHQPETLWSQTDNLAWRTWSFWSHSFRRAFPGERPWWRRLPPAWRISPGRVPPMTKSDGNSWIQLKLYSNRLCQLLKSTLGIKKMSAAFAYMWRIPGTYETKFLCVHLGNFI